MSVGAHRGVLDARGVRARTRMLWQALAVAAVAVAAAAAVFGTVYAGSSARIAEGVRIAGVDVGGMTPDAARALLERRAAALEGVPVTFFSGRQRWQITPHRLGVEADWRAAVDAAQRAGEGLGPFRGLRRVKVRVFGADIAPPAKVYEPALDYQLDLLALQIDRRSREPAVVLDGRKPVLVPGAAGRTLVRERAAATIVGALAALARAPTPLPVRIDAPEVRTEELRAAVAQTRVALSAPVRLELGKTWWRLRPGRILELLSLPRDGARTVTIDGPGAERWFSRFARTVNRAPVDARFVATGTGEVAIEPHRAGVALDVAATRAGLRRAIVSPRARVADVVVSRRLPALTTREARGLGITHVLASYSTYYAGTEDRIRNLQRAVALIDGTLVRPSTTFSLNEAVGPRTVERGFRTAPVIIGGEYKEDVGGGVSQVATTVFNAAWEAGLKILERAPHSLFISRYPLGRDATVNYPNLDLKFLNDTRRWLVVLGGIGSDGISITIAGAPTGRRVVSTAGPLEVTGPVPVKRVPDPTLTVGTEVVEEEGSPARAVTVKRTVYDDRGRVLYDETWRTSYRGDKRVVRYGTKPAPPEPKPAPTETEPEPKPKPRAEEPPKGERKPAPPPTEPPPAPTEPVTP